MVVRPLGLTITDQVAATVVDQVIRKATADVSDPMAALPGAVRPADPSGPAPAKLIAGLALSTVLRTSGHGRPE
jgi:hypothetical protein